MVNPNLRIGGMTYAECLAASAERFCGRAPDRDVSPLDLAGARESLELGEADQPGHRVQETKPVKRKRTVENGSKQRALF